jgi:hypothetical protein
LVKQNHGFETRSFPNSLAATHRGFTFYLADPISSVLTSALRFRFDLAVITRDDIAVRTIVDLPQEQIRKLTLFCRREKISRAEAVRRAVDRFLRGSPASDLRSFFGASRTRGKISKHVARLRQEWTKRRPAREDLRS